MSATFDSVLVANRGEIAVRIVRACREFGLRSVVAHSAADAGSQAVALADAAVCVGPPPARDSYLNAAAMLYACARADTGAIHPGYGFLSEDAYFAEACAQAGITFIGPPPAVLRLTGDKLAARRRMAEAGLPVLPGSDGPLTDAREAYAVAARIGGPVILKAATGGGGGGIRVAHELGEVEAAFTAVQRDARRTCLTDEVFVERFVKHARHVEVQVMADRWGRVVHVGERDCTIQRRRQKLVEETPSLAISPELRERLCDFGLAAASAVGYQSAGTVEFLVDHRGELSFCEINPRIQVEHCVSEQAFGVDLVGTMIRLAAGDQLPFAQADLHSTGHVIECRINAEDPARGWAAATGRIGEFHPPAGAHVRVDTHAHDGFVVGPHYDSLLAKLVVTGADRPEALRRMRVALDEFHCTGVATNLAFHRKLMDHPVFCAGEHQLDFLERFGTDDGGLREKLVV